MDKEIAENLMKSNYAKIPDGTYSGVITDIKSGYTLKHNPFISFIIKSFNDNKSVPFYIRAIYYLNSENIAEALKSINEVSINYNINLLDVLAKDKPILKALKPMIGKDVLYKVYHKPTGLNDGSLYKDIILVNE